jgi:hypothetical protein
MRSSNDSIPHAPSNQPIPPAEKDSQTTAIAQIHRKLDIVSEHTIALPGMFDPDRVSHAYEKHVEQFGVNKSLRTYVDSITARLRISQLHARNASPISTSGAVATIRRKVNDWISDPHTKNDDELFVVAILQLVKDNMALHAQVDSTRRSNGLLQGALNSASKSTLMAFDP